jgi:hypothetical protein
VIPAITEVKVGGSQPKASPAKARPYLKNEQRPKDWEYGSSGSGRPLPSKHDVLSSILHTGKKNKEKRGSEDEMTDLCCFLAILMT